MKSIFGFRINLKFNLSLQRHYAEFLVSVDVL